MSTNLDKSLDDIINENKKSGSGNSRGGGGRGRSGPGPTRRFPNRAANRAGPYIPAKAPDTTWQHDLFTDQAMAAFPAQAGRASAIETGTKLYISNLDYGVSNEDIKELFSEVGDLKRYGVHYDRSGRSKGTAEVVYSRRQDAMSALKRYNNVQLDGKPMKIEIVGTNMAAPPAAAAAAAAAAAVAAAAAPLPPVLNGVGFGNSNGVPRGGRGRGVAMGRPRGGGRGFGRGRGRGRGRGEKISAEDLDADLEKYHSEAMETN